RPQQDCDSPADAWPDRRRVRHRNLRIEEELTLDALLQDLSPPMIDSAFSTPVIPHGSRPITAVCGTTAKRAEPPCGRRRAPPTREWGWSGPCRSPRRSSCRPPGRKGARAHCPANGSQTTPPRCDQERGTYVVRASAMTPWIITVTCVSRALTG